ncbi:MULTISPECIES: EamA/RhaT family transporter [Streptomyces]|uniref:EamA/RhaT family transporter n=1 Tax=Streptomyces TaxID=1883 RepID=UPI0028681479|nr:EamA/RhaT family transporter [Streptomyces griseoaurantiacus]
MSERNGRNERVDGQTAGRREGEPPAEAGEAPGSRDAPGSGGGPRPEPLRFFGTTWLDHEGGPRGYAVRRVAVCVGSLAAAALGCLVLRLAYEGLRIADVGSAVTVLMVVMFAVCSALAFSHTRGAFTRRPDPDRQASLRGLLAIGFIGSLLAYFLRSLKEAPGESLHREEYEEARARHRKRAGRRTGNPSRRRRGKA